MRIGLHTRLLAGAEEGYEDLHRSVPPELREAIRSAGFSDWVIFRDGVDLFHCITVDDYDTAIAAIAELPVNVAWQAQVGRLAEVAHDYSGEASDRMTMVWDLAW